LRAVAEKQRSTKKLSARSRKDFTIFLLRTGVLEKSLAMVQEVTTLNSKFGLSKVTCGGGATM